MPRDFNFEGSGHRGAEFEQKGMSERNLGVLLKSLSNRETAKSIEALSKIEKDEWKSIATTAIQLNEFVVVGGITEVFANMKDSINETIQLQIDSMLSGLTNQINEIINAILNPFIQEWLVPLINNLSTFLAENSVGAGAGGLVGAFTAKFLPGGSIWVVLGSFIGSLLEFELKKFFEGESSYFSDQENAWPVFLILFQRAWEAIFGGGGVGGIVGIVGAPRLPTYGR